MSVHEEYPSEGQVPFYPHHFLTEAVVAFGLLAALIVLSSLVPAGLEEQADPFLTPQHVKPEWYFLSVYQLLKLVPKTLGILLPPIFLVFLTLFPFIDRGKDRRPLRRPFATAGVVLVILFLVGFTIWGLKS